MFKKLKNRIIAMALVVVGLLPLSSCKKKDVDTKEETTTETTTSYSEIGFGSIDDLGFELNEEEITIYGNATGDVDINKVVVGSDGDLYVDQDAANNSNNVGTYIDDNNGEYSVTIDANGNTKVYDNEQGYEIQDENGNVIETGIADENGVPEGYQYDEVISGYVEEEYVDTMVVCDNNYYGPDGTLVFAKGELVTKEILEKAKRELSTTKPKDESNEIVSEEIITYSEEEIESQYEASTSNNIETESTSIQENTNQNLGEGTVNEDGTYTIYGATWESKEDYEQFILNGYSGYAMVDGIMVSEDELTTENVKSKN